MYWLTFMSVCCSSSFAANVPGDVYEHMLFIQFCCKCTCRLLWAYEAYWKVLNIIWLINTLSFFICCSSSFAANVPGDVYECMLFIQFCCKCTWWHLCVYAVHPVLLQMYLLTFMNVCCSFIPGQVHRTRETSKQAIKDNWETTSMSYSPTNN